MKCIISLCAVIFVAFQTSAQVLQRFDVVIDEIFADPTPTVKLPSVEFIEIKNTSTASINLQGWRLSSLTTTSSAFPSYVLPPDSFLVITSTANAPLFSGYGRVLGVGSFPTLDNTGTTLTLTSRENATIHSVPYNVSWFQNAVKSEGGWTLEM
ncbi:MAG TPA: lamin tail domain-containing protein, partial [Segetibacter sp.]